MIEIRSRDNPRLKALLRRKEEYFVFAGEKLVRDALRRGGPPDILVLDQAALDEWRGEAALAKECWLVSTTVLARLSPLESPPPVLAFYLQLSGAAVFPGRPLVIGLDGVQDPGNAGAVFRSAAAFSAAVALCGPTVNPRNPKFLRAAQSVLWDVPWAVVAGREELIHRLQGQGYTVYLTAAHAATAVAPAEIRPPALVLLGSEGGGLPTELFSRFPAVCIAQEPLVESLNVAVAAGILMHAVYSRRHGL